VIAGGRELVHASAAFLERFVAVALHHQLAARQFSISGITYGKLPAWLANCMSRRQQMASILSAEDVVRLIAAECAYIDERGGVGIRLEPAAAIVRRVRRAIPDAAATASASGETPSPGLI
jgi:hypothetical protein